MLDQRYRFNVEYDGTEFAGWQWQPGVRTVQEILETALERIFGHLIRVNGAGRTDAGVHALGQTAHFDAPPKLDPSKLQLALNGQLPQDVRIFNIQKAAADFHSRHLAKWRWYRYRVFKRPRAVERQLGWFPKYRLRSEVLQQAAHYLIGAHDFTSFSCCRVGEGDIRHGASCIVYAAGWELSPEEWRFHIVANRFVRHMVRGLVGAMVDVGRDRFDLGEFTGLLDNPRKPNLIYNAPARGLCLMQVGYEDYPYQQPRIP
jgi:tRNA pseudouridine38-40 synthase